MESAGPPPARTRSSLVSARLILRPVPWDAVLAITGDERLDDWADDYPSDDDVVIAGLLLGADQAAGPGRGQVPAGDAAGQVAAGDAGGQVAAGDAGDAQAAGQVAAGDTGDAQAAGQVAAGDAGDAQAAGQAAVETGDEDWGHRQIVERASGLVVGGIGFFGPPRGGEVEIGYGIVPSRQGRGYATEALGTMIAMAWADARVTAVAAGTDPGNAASQRVLEKAGFRRVAATGEFRYQLMRPA